MFKPLKIRHLALVALSTFTVVSPASRSRFRILHLQKRIPDPGTLTLVLCPFPGHPDLLYFSSSLHIQLILCKYNIWLLMSDFFHRFHPKY